MRVIAVTQARVGSTRLPGKVLKLVAGVSLLEVHIHRILKARQISELVVATTTNQEDEAVKEIAEKSKVSCYRGSEYDVLDRFYQAVKGRHPDYVVRLTSDCPLIDPMLIDKVVQCTIDKRLDYCSNTLDPKYPDGQDIEVFTMAALETAWKMAIIPSDREHVTPFIWKNSRHKGGDLFRSYNFDEGLSFGHLRMTVDEPADLEVIRAIVSSKGVDASWLDYARFLEGTNLGKLNEGIERNAGYTKSINKEK